jgi:hypothetical protein
VSAQRGRFMRVTAKGQRAIGAPVTVTLRVEYEQLLAICNAAQDALRWTRAASRDPLQGLVNVDVANDYCDALGPALLEVVAAMNQAAGDAGIDAGDVRAV